MSQFGLPSRSASSDANEGVINPPTVKHEARSQNLQKVKPTSSLDIGVEKVGSALGGALAKHLDEKKTHINKQRALDAKIAQGTNVGIINSMKEKKRTGWQKWVYGENVEYRAAQQQAAENAIQNHYLGEAVRVDEFAGHSPEDYKARLKDGLNSVLEKYEGDSETQSIIAGAWQDQSAKLAAKQFEAHYGWNQMQQAEQSRVLIRQSIDTFNIEASKATSPEEAAAIANNIAGMFNRSLKREGQSIESYDGILNDELDNSLKQGGINMYKYALALGWESRQSAGTLAKRDTSISAYDTDFGQQVGAILSNGEIAAIEAETIGDAAAAYDTLDTRIDEMEVRLSGTERGDKIIADARLRIARGRAAALRSGAVKQAKAEKLEAQRDTWGINDPQDRALAQAEIGLDTEKEAGDSADAYIVSQLAQMSGNPELTQSEAFTKILSDPNAAKLAAHFYENRDVNSPMVKRVMTQFISGFENTFDEENGRPTQDSLAQLANAELFLKNKKTQANIGQKNYDEFIEVAKGIRQGRTAKMITEDVRRFHENSENVENFPQWPLNKKDHQTKQDYVSQIVKQRTGQYPTVASTVDMMETYKRGLIHSNGDHGGAKQYLLDSLDSQTTTVQGKVIWGGNTLDKLSPSGIKFEKVVAFAEKQGMMAAVLSRAGVAPIDSPTGTTHVKELSRLRDDWTMEMDPNGILLKSISFQQPTLISYDELEQWAEMAEVQREVEAKQEASKAQAIERSWIGQDHISNPRL